MLRRSSWLWLWLCFGLGICMFLPGEPEAPELYPGIKTPEALLRGSLPPFNTVEEAKSKTCAIAARPLPAYLPLALFEDDRQALKAYKDAWLTLCRQPRASALAEAYQLSLDLEKMLREPIFGIGLPDAAADEPDAALRIDTIYQRLDALDAVVPAFFGTAEGFEYYAPNWTLFYLAALDATQEDQAFFRLHFQLRRHPLFYPWIEAAADMGVCTLFGEYRWEDGLAAIEEVLGESRHPIYVRSLQEWRAALLGAFEVGSGKPQLCSCRSGPQEVLQDGENLLAALAAFPEQSLVIGRFSGAIEKIKKYPRLVRNYREEGCVY